MSRKRKLWLSSNTLFVILHAKLVAFYIPALCSALLWWRIWTLNNSKVFHMKPDEDTFWPERSEMVFLPESVHWFLWQPALYLEATTSHFVIRLRFSSTKIHRCIGSCMGFRSVQCHYFSLGRWRHESLTFRFAPSLCHPIFSAGETACCQYFISLPAECLPLEGPNSVLWGKCQLYWNQGRT